MTSCTKPELYNLLHCRRQRRTEPLQKIWWNLDVRCWKYASGQSNTQTDRQTDRQTKRHAVRYWGEV